MTQADTTNPQETAPSQTCGNCGAVTATDAITCPACGVLLAAYQAPAGAIAAAEPIPAAYDSASPSTAMGASGDTSATRDVPSAPMTGPVEAAPAPAPPVSHRPRSQSPIMDALKRTQTEDVETSTIEDSAAAATELEAMAADETDFSREVEAELAGAKVTFDGNTAVLTSEADAPPPVEHPPAVAVAPTAPAPRQRQPVRTAPRYENPVAVDTAPDSGPVKPVPTPASRFGGAFFFVVILILFFSVALRMPVLGAISGLIIAIAVVAALLKLASLSGRKTTSMPRDERWNRSRKRPR